MLRALVLVLLALASSCSASSASTTTTTTVTTTCTVSDDITSAVTNWLTTMTGIPSRTVVATSRLFSSQYAGYSSIALSGTSANPINTTFSQFLWSMTKGSNQPIGVGYATGEYFAYSYSTSLLGFQFIYCPAGSTTMNYYYVNQVTGQIIYPYFKQASFFTTQRPYYTAGAAARGALTLNTVYGSVTSSTVGFSAAIAFYSPTNNAMLGVIQSTYSLTLPSQLPTLNQYLMGLNVQPSTVVYVMSSTGLLMGSSVNAPVAMNIFANNSVNSIISGSALYLQRNKITTSCSVYAAGLGYAITVQNFNPSYASWTVVSVNYAGLTVGKSIVSNVVTVTNSDDDSTPVNTQSTTYVNQSCTVQTDITVTVADWLPGYMQTSAWIANSTAAIFASNYGGYQTIGNSGASFAQPINSTLQQYLWTMVKSSGGLVSVGYTTSQYFGYSYITSLNQLVFTFCPAGSTSLSYYYVNQNTGEILGAPYQVTTFFTTQRPWYLVGARTPAGTVTFTNPYGSATSNSMLFSATTPMYDPTGAFIGVIGSTNTLTTPAPALTLSQSLASLAVPASTVVYVMETSQSILLGNSAGAPVGINILANASSNVYIQQSAQWVISNAVTGATSVYVKSLGWAITVKFVTNLGVTWTVVSVYYGAPTSATTSTTTSTTFESASSSSGITSQQSTAILGLGAAIFVLSVVVVGVLVFNFLCSRPSQPLAEQAQKPASVEMGKV